MGLEPTRASHTWSLVMPVCQFQHSCISAIKALAWRICQFRYSCISEWYYIILFRKNQAIFHQFFSNFFSESFFAFLEFSYTVQNNKKAPIPVIPAQTSQFPLKKSRQGQAKIPRHIFLRIFMLQISNVYRRVKTRLIKRFPENLTIIFSPVCWPYYIQYIRKLTESL